MPKLLCFLSSRSLSKRILFKRMLLIEANLRGKRREIPYAPSRHQPDSVRVFPSTIETDCSPAKARENFLCGLSFPSNKNIKLCWRIAMRASTSKLGGRERARYHPLPAPVYDGKSAPAPSSLSFATALPRVACFAVRDAAAASAPSQVLPDRSQSIALQSHLNVLT